MRLYASIVSFGSMPSQYAVMFPRIPYCLPVESTIALYLLEYPSKLERFLEGVAAPRYLSSGPCGSNLGSPEELLPARFREVARPCAEGLSQRATLHPLGVFRRSDLIIVVRVASRLDGPLSEEREILWQIAATPRGKLQEPVDRG